jgi:hypothetical protein
MPNLTGPYYATDTLNSSESGHLATAVACHGGFMKRLNVDQGASFSTPRSRGFSAQRHPP